MGAVGKMCVSVDISDCAMEMGCCGALNEDGFQNKMVRMCIKMVYNL